MAACATGATTATTPEVGTSTIMVGDTTLTVWVADDPAERRQGLRGLDDLPVDGMLFVWDTPARAGFGMGDTLIDLDIWWFDPTGVLIGTTEMSTCPDGDCVSYGSPGLIGWALETPAGVYRFQPGDRLTTSENG